MVQFATLFAGIAWDPHFRGVFSVLVGVVVLGGSIYLILGTNMGGRLGLLVTFAALFGWMVILSAFWWIQPPGNGPRGTNNSWKPVEVFVNEPGNEPLTESLNTLPDPSLLPTSAQLLADHPELGVEYPNGFVLSDVQATHPDIIKAEIGDLDLGGWRVLATSSAGEAQGVADTTLVSSGLFSATTEYKKLNTFEFGGKPRRTEVCPDAEGGNLVPDDVLCRIRYRIDKIVNIKHPTHYAVVEVQQVIPQVARPGEAPPLPKVDPDAPVISVVMVRDLGNVRLIPALYFVISLIGFVFFVLVLHYREKTLNKNLADADAAGLAAGK